MSALPAKADKYADISLSPLCAKSGLMHRSKRHLNSKQRRRQYLPAVPTGCLAEFVHRASLVNFNTSARGITPVYDGLLTNLPSARVKGSRAKVSLVCPSSRRRK